MPTVLLVLVRGAVFHERGTQVGRCLEVWEGPGGGGRVLVCKVPLQPSPCLLDAEWPFLLSDHFKPPGTVNLHLGPDDVVLRPLTVSVQSRQRLDYVCMH